MLIKIRSKQRHGRDFLYGWVSQGLGTIEFAIWLAEIEIEK